MTSYVVASSECGYAFRLAFCHSADKKRYAQIISGYVPARRQYGKEVLLDLSLVKALSSNVYCDNDGFGGVAILMESKWIQNVKSVNRINGTLINIRMLINTL